MDIVATYIENTKTDVSDIRNELKTQLDYLERRNNEKNCIVTQIREMTDENCVQMLIDRCDEIQKINRDKHYWIHSAKNIKIMQDGMKLKTKHEIDLLNTLYRISTHTRRNIYNPIVLFCNVSFTLNGHEFGIEIEKHNENKHNIITCHCVDCDE